MASATGETTTINTDTISYLEDLIIVWLDETIDINNIIWSKRQSHFRNRINYIRTFTEKNKYPWVKLFSKIRGVFNDENLLMVRFDKDVKMHSNMLTPIKISYSNERSLQDIDKEQVAFLWFQLMIEVIYRLPQTSISKQQMIDKCCTEYNDNPAQLQMIDEFYNKYSADLAIEWYIKDSILFRLLNKAFRTQDIDIVFSYHYFLSDLTKALPRLYLNQFGGKTGTLTVYRGQHMHIDEVQRLQNSIGRLMSVNTFFSTSTSCIVAADFSRNVEYRSQGIESVVFQIEIDLSVQRRPFARIDQLSNTKDENEILFAAGSVFRIESVELLTDDIWLFILILTDEVKREVEDLLAYFIKQIGMQPSLLELGVLLSKIGDFEQAKRFYLRLQNELPENHYDLGVLYNNLGEIYRKEKDLDKAMEYYKLAIDELTESYGFLDPWFGVVHSNIAMIYDVRRQFDRALIHYRCALHIIERDRDCDEGELFSTIYNGMATIFQQTGQLKTALKLYEKTLKIELAILPSGHPSIATTYNNIGQLHFQMEDSSKALENLLKALPIMLSTLPDNHPDLACLYASIGSIYISENQISKAIAHLLQAQEIIHRSTLTADHKLREDIYRTFTIFSRKYKIIDVSIRLHHKLIDVYKARTPPDQYEIVLWTSSRGRLLFNQGNRQQAFEYHQISLDIVQQLPRTEKNKDLYSIILDGLQQTGHFDIVVEHYTSLLNEESNTQSLFAGKLHNNLGVVYDYMENDLLALKHYTAALTCYDSQPDTFANQTATIHYNIAVILSNLSEYECARLSLCKTLNILSEHDYDFLGKCHYLLGEIYEKTYNWICAREHFHETIESATRANSHPQFIAKCTRHLQQVLTKTEENTSANFEPITKSIED